MKIILIFLAGLVLGLLVYFGYSQIKKPVTTTEQNLVSSIMQQSNSILEKEHTPSPLVPKENNNKDVIKNFEFDLTKADQFINVREEALSEDSKNYNTKFSSDLFNFSAILKGSHDVRDVQFVKKPVSGMKYRLPTLGGDAYFKYQEKENVFIDEANSSYSNGELLKKITNAKGTVYFQTLDGETGGFWSQFLVPLPGKNYWMYFTYSYPNLYFYLDENELTENQKTEISSEQYSRKQFQKFLDNLEIIE